MQEVADPAAEPVTVAGPGAWPVPSSADSDLRLWLARELHDSVVQALSTMVIEMEQFRLTLRPTGDTRHLDHWQAAAREALAGLRETVDELRGETQPDRRLVSAVSQAAERLHQETGVGMALSIAPDWPAAVPRSLARNLYRVIEEALNNIRAHSGASQVTISMWTAGDTAVVSVLDDGQGFEQQVGGRQPYLEGLGLVGMRERALLIGGSLRVESEPGGGTKVSLTFPLPAAG